MSPSNAGRDRRRPPPAAVAPLPRLLLVLLTLVATACGGAAPRERVDPFGQDAQAIGLVVRNQFGLDVTLYALGPAVRERLGPVRGNRRAEFVVPWTEVADLVVQVEASGRPEFRTNAVPMHPGDVATLTISSDLRSTVLSRN